MPRSKFISECDKAVESHIIEHGELHNQRG